MDDEEARPFSVKPAKATSPQPLAPLIVTQAAPRGFVRGGGVFSPEAMLLHAQSPSTEAEAVAEADNTLEAKLEATKGGKKKAKAKQQHRPAGGGHDRRTQAQLRAACAPIILALLPDERLYVWDGHHRVAAIHLGGRDHLLPEEYSTMRCNFKFAQTVSFATWFLTPFDPRTEIRVPEFGSFKNEVAVQLKKKKKPEAEMYVLPRTFESVAEMVARMDLV
ncbi:uncharacterized protein ACA1_071950 [Acanthamoeba castellanii str. Neff]|uniref:ParB/Sulfiredoxin domain-containing protein n=1 Tax=Acanthamoeba castellanii (strain ATCC 30010 / Neff) TaxID=1257118 RepID=L8HFS2_ACACF|nr:uncharacterized protein ACA1_071950 [Acanthamoeba castellanii str. Neff]ELR23573.1 hypothetical protein ACA1_071950 [Acanthamoeba castellanii str. Neff]